MAASPKSASVAQPGDCIVRNISENGAGIEFSNVVRLPKEQMSLAIARKGRSFLARIIWWRDNFVGVAFSEEKPSELPDSDLGERLRPQRAEEATASAPHQTASGWLNKRIFSVPMESDRSLYFLLTMPVSAYTSAATSRCRKIRMRENA